MFPESCLRSTVMALTVSYRVVRMIMMVPHGAEAKHQVSLCIHVRCSNPFPHFLSLINAAFDYSGRPQIVVAVNRVMKYVAFDHGNTVFTRTLHTLTYRHTHTHTHTHIHTLTIADHACSITVAILNAPSQE